MLSLKYVLFAISFIASVLGSANDNPLIIDIAKIENIFDLYVADNPDDGHLALLNLKDTNGDYHVKLVWIPLFGLYDQPQFYEIPIAPDQVPKSKFDSGFSINWLIRHTQRWTLDGRQGLFILRNSVITLFQSKFRRINFEKASAERNGSGTSDWSRFRDSFEWSFGHFFEPKSARLHLAEPSAFIESPAHHYLSKFKTSHMVISWKPIGNERPEVLSEFSTFLFTLPTSSSKTRLDLSKAKLVAIKSDGTVIEFPFHSFSDIWVNGSLMDQYVHFEALGIHIKMKGNLLNASFKYFTAPVKYSQNVIAVFQDWVAVNFNFEIAGDSRVFNGNAADNLQNFEAMLRDSSKAQSGSPETPITKLLNRVERENPKSCIGLF